MFNGGLQSRTRCALVCELVKYLSFQRNQIPLPVDHVKRDLKKRTEKEGNTHEARINRVEHRKSKEFVTVLDKIMENLHTAFDHCPDIRQVLIIIGGTSVSPKEMYRVTIPPYYPDATPVSEKSSIKILFRQLITDDFLGSVNPLSATSTMLLLNAPRNCGLEWFLAKPHYKPPNRGRVYELNLHCAQPPDSGTDLSLMDHHFEISGIQPLDSSNNDISMSESDLICQETSSDSDSVITDMTSDSFSLAMETNALGANIVKQCAMTEDEGVHSLSDEDYIWFQAPLSIKGYKDRTSKVRS
ncbi:MAD2L1-binding protein-like [Liolophura sinensis]|uniref:MAD2L1-binding protein-like n=1 Tax=Liolophura sinensis TaxID=3198878 RepID=UPI003159105A